MALELSKMDAPPPRVPFLNMAAQAEAEALRESAAAEERRLRQQVNSSLLRVAGDAKGTASTLVGLTAEEADELVMLQSRVAAEQPPERPKAHQLVHGPEAAASTSNPSAPLPSLAPLSAVPNQSFTGGRSYGQLVEEASNKPGGALKALDALRKKKGGTGMKESLLGNVEQDAVLAPLSMAPLQMNMAPQVPQTQPLPVPQTQPLAVPQTQPAAQPVAAPMSTPYQPPPDLLTGEPIALPPRPVDVTDHHREEDEWDDADRPLQLPPGGGNVGGVQRRTTADFFS